MRIWLLSLSGAARDFPAALFWLHFEGNRQTASVRRVLSEQRDCEGLGTAKKCTCAQHEPRRLTTSRDFPLIYRAFGYNFN